MAAPLEPTPSRDYNAIMFAAAAVPMSPPRIQAPTMPPGDAADLRATCRLHGPHSLYTRNSDGYYSTYSAGCNGCSVGDREAAENAAADRVRELHAQLTVIWATEHGRYTANYAEYIAKDLRAAIAHLNEISGIILNPQQYAERMLTAHDIAAALDGLLVEAAVRDPYVSLRHHISNAMDRLRGSNCGSDPTTWPIWSVATEMLASMEDHVADESY